MKERTNTSGNTLTPQGHYEATIDVVNRKEVKGGFIIYEWNFTALKDNKPFYFKIGLFSSQMGDLIRACGGVEISKNDWEWDRDEVVGLTLGFDITHKEDKNGIPREQVSNVVCLTTLTKPKVDTEVKWD